MRALLIGITLVAACSTLVAQAPPEEGKPVAIIKKASITLKKSKHGLSATVSKDYQAGTRYLAKEFKDCKEHCDKHSTDWKVRSKDKSLVIWDSVSGRWVAKWSRPRQELTVADTFSEKVAKEEIVAELAARDQKSKKGESNWWHGFHDGYWEGYQSRATYNKGGTSTWFLKKASEEQRMSMAYVFAYEAGFAAGKKVKEYDSGAADGWVAKNAYRKFVNTKEGVFVPAHIQAQTK